MFEVHNNVEGFFVSKDKKSLDFELNLIPFIDLLSVCICFLLLTAVWLQIGSINVKQAVGGQSAEETKKIPALWAQMQVNGNVILKFHDFPNAVSRKFGGGQILVKSTEDGKVNYEDLEAKISTVLEALPELDTGLVVPQGESEYETVILLMDRLKKVGLVNLGVSPI